ncbi:MAG TPA: response regulator [Clostridiaceae bacterium]|nr:response regulator [Clostridiaceae bacterium]
MTNIMVVDDEAPIREWFVFLLNNHPDYNVVACASNGAEAYEKFLKYRPEIVLTDIKMPVMDGLELTGKIRQYDKHVKIVVITAFDEFEFARQAIVLGANNYILKTEIEEASFFSMLNEMARQYNEAKQESKSYETPAFMPLELEIMIKQVLLKKTKLNDTDLAILRKYNIVIDNSGIFVVAFWKLQLSGPFIIPQFDNIYNVVVLPIDETIGVLIANIHSVNSIQKQYDIILNYANSIATSNCTRIGISQIISNINQLSFGIYNAIDSLCECYYSDKQLIFEFSEESYKKQENLTLWMNKIRHEIREKIGKELFYSFINMLDSIEKKRPHNIQAIKNFCIEVIELIITQQDANMLSSGEFESLKNQIKNSICFKDLRECAIAFVQKICLVDRFKNKKLSHNVILAVKYIRNHFRDPISLVDVAESININPEYLSRIFKDEIGESYSEFISNLRLSEARKLLLKTNMQISEIAETVGYPNISYFSTVFKNKYGISPSSFRNKLLNQE